MILLEGPVALQHPDETVPADTGGGGPAGDRFAAVVADGALHRQPPEPDRRLGDGKRADHRPLVVEMSLGLIKGLGPGLPLFPVFGAGELIAGKLGPIRDEWSRFEDRRHLGRRLGVRTAGMEPGLAGDFHRIAGGKTLPVEIDGHLERRRGEITDQDPQRFPLLLGKTARQMEPVPADSAVLRQFDLAIEGPERGQNDIFPLVDDLAHRVLDRQMVPRRRSLGLAGRCRAGRIGSVSLRRHPCAESPDRRERLQRRAAW